VVDLEISIPNRSISPEYADIYLIALEHFVCTRRIEGSELILLLDKSKSNMKTNHFCLRLRHIANDSFARA
jgi:hypothetical protein